MDSLLTSGKTASYVGMDNYLAGKEALREIARQLGGNGDVAIVTYSKGGINGIQRERESVMQLTNMRDFTLLAVNCARRRTKNVSKPSAVF